MNKIFRMLVFAVVMFAAGTTAHADAVVGGAAPEFQLPGADGEIYALSNHRGNFVVLEWTNPDCPFVKKHYNSGNMQNLQKRYGQKGVIWFSINSSAEGKQGHYSPQEWDRITQEKNAAPTAVLLDSDGSVGKAYGAKTTPHMYIINREGLLIYQGAIDSIASADQGDIPLAVNHVQQALDEAMSGKPVSVPTSKSYGCGVKY